MFGNRIAHFRILEELSHDPLTSNFRALDESLRREVVVRVLHPNLAADAQILQEFIHGARCAAQVNHQHILQVYFVGVESQVPYVVQELVQGKSLEETLEEMVRLPEAMILSLAEEACEGLQCALKSGLVHLDIRPENLMIDERHGIKVANFGRSLLLDRQEANGKKTCYISPEQLSGKVTDHRCDIYSLGATIYHALTGRPPILEREMRLHLQKGHPLHHQPVEKFLPTISERTRDIVEKMIEPETKKRYQNYEELLDDLHEAQKSVVVVKTASKKKTTSKSLPFKGLPPDNVTPATTNPTRQSKPFSWKIPALVLTFLGTLFGLWSFMQGGTEKPPDLQKVEILFRDPSEKVLDERLNKYHLDEGAPFARRKNGLTYGWNRSTAGWNFKDDRAQDIYYSSYLKMESDMLWEIEVPNGNYKVTVRGARDMTRDFIYDIHAEGFPLLASIPFMSLKSVEGTAVIHVDDGRLTLSSGPNISRRNFICSIALEKTSEPPSKPVRVELISPKIQKTLIAPATISLEAKISSNDSQSTLSFTDGVDMMAKYSNSPYQITLHDLGFGNHRFHALVVTGDGRTAISDPMEVQVQSPNRLENALRINFQPPNTPPLEHCLPDSGEAFGVKTGQFTYGWTQAHQAFGAAYSDKYHAEQSIYSLDSYHDTWAEFDKTHEGVLASHIWEMELPNGFYKVRIVAGGPWSDRQKSASLDYQILAENTLILKDTIRPGRWWVDSVQIVEVKDGRLTISCIPNGVSTKVSFVEIISEK